MRKIKHNGLGQQTTGITMILPHRNPSSFPGNPRKLVAVISTTPGQASVTEACPGVVGFL